MLNSSTTYNISDLAKEFGITTRTIRHYEDLGLLAPKRRGQTRIYSRGDRTRLKLILRGKRLGFSLEESRDIIQLYDPAHNNQQQLQQLLNRIDQQEQRLQECLDDIQSMMVELNQAKVSCQQAMTNN